jgi:hypothetical protein
MLYQPEMEYFRWPAAENLDAVIFKKQRKIRIALPRRFMYIAR